MIAKEVNLNGQWINLYEELGVTNDKTVFIQNKSSGPIFIWPNDTVPQDNTTGLHLRIGETIVLSAEGESLNVNGSGVIYVSVVTITGVTEGVGGSSGRQLVEPLGTATVARRIPASASSDIVTLTSTCKRISIRALGCNMRYITGTGALTANAQTSHYIAQDERLDLAVPAGASIAAIRESLATVNGVLEITELE